MLNKVKKLNKHIYLMIYVYFFKFKNTDSNIQLFYLKDKLIEHNKFQEEQVIVFMPMFRFCTAIL